MEETYMKPRREPVSPFVDRVAAIVVDSAFTVHKQLGPGLLESIYEACLAHELQKMGLSVQRQVNLPIIYDGIRFDHGLRIDMIVEGCVIVEVKAVEKTLPVLAAQLLSYLRLSKHPLGFLINFNVPLIRDGLKRTIL